MTNPKPMKARGWKIFNRNGTLEIQDAAGTPIVHWMGFDSVDGPESRKLANAKLMRAAPEMAAALRIAAKRERELVAALKKYGRHWACPVGIGIMWRENAADSHAKRCTCGLAAAIRGGGR